MPYPNIYLTLYPKFQLLYTPYKSFKEHRQNTLPCLFDLCNKATISLILHHNESHIQL